MVRFRRPLTVRSPPACRLRRCSSRWAATAAQQHHRDAAVGLVHIEGARHQFGRTQPVRERLVVHKDHLRPEEPITDIPFTVAVPVVLPPGGIGLAPHWYGHACVQVLLPIDVQPDAHRSAPERRPRRALDDHDSVGRLSRRVEGDGFAVDACRDVDAHGLSVRVLTSRAPRRAESCGPDCSPCPHSYPSPTD